MGLRNVDTSKLRSISRRQGIKPRLVEMTSDSILGLTYQSRRGIYHILVNKDLPSKLRDKVLAHEFYHIMNDVRCDRIISTNMQYEKIEENAEEVAQAVVKA